QQILDEELARLPDRYRLPLVLCYLEDRTHDEAAARLGWPVGTVKSRLARGREQLRKRLTRRGLTLSVAALATALAAGAAPAAVPAAWVRTAVRVAALVAAGKAPSEILSDRSVALAEGALRSLARGRLALALLGALSLALVGGVLALPAPQSPAVARPVEPR